MPTPVVGEGAHLVYPQEIRLPILGAASGTPPTATVAVYARTESGISQLFYKDDAGVERPLGPGTLLGLVDSPSSYASQGLKVLRVNTDADAIEFFTHDHTGDPHHQYLLVDDFPHDRTMHQNAVLPGVANENFGTNYFDIGIRAGPNTPPADVRRIYLASSNGILTSKTDTGAFRRLENIFSATTPAAVAAAGSVGTGDDLVRSNHIHPHGTGYLPDAHHAEAHGVSKHTGKIGECPFGPIRIVLTKALPAATNNATLDDDWSYQSPWTNEAQRISRWYIRFSSNLAAAATFELRKNGTLITGATFTVALGARDAAVDSFTETTLADDDSLEVWQTAGNAEDIGGSAYIYGDQDVVDVVSYA